VAGPAVEAQLFATAWTQIRGFESYLATDQRLYRLTQVDRPIGIPGNARLVTENDVETLMQWIQEFYREAIPWEMPTFEQIRENAKNRIPLRLTFFWEVEGKPVAMDGFFLSVVARLFRQHGGRYHVVRGRNTGLSRNRRDAAHAIFSGTKG
jgi:hypothetical protein